MNFRIKDFIALVFISILFGFAILYFFDQVSKIQNKPITKERVSYLRDSLEMEYYKKQLETFPFEHSKLK